GVEAPDVVFRQAPASDLVGVCGEKESVQNDGPPSRDLTGNLRRDLSTCRQKQHELSPIIDGVVGEIEQQRADALAEDRATRLTKRDRDGPVLGESADESLDLRGFADSIRALDYDQPPWARHELAEGDDRARRTFSDAVEDPVIHAQHD